MIQTTTNGKKIMNDQLDGREHALFKFQVCSHFNGVSRAMESAILTYLELFESEKSAKLEILRSSGTLRSFVWR